MPTITLGRYSLGRVAAFVRLQLQRIRSQLGLAVPLQGPALPDPPPPPLGSEASSQHGCDSVPGRGGVESSGMQTFTVEMGWPFLQPMPGAGGP